MTKLQLTEKTLTDGSLVYDLVISQDGHAVTIPAVSEKDGGAVMEAMAEIINAHSNETVVTGF